jgi:hypothetical protein
MNEQVPLPYGAAARAVIGCVASTVGLLVHRRVHLSSEHLGTRLWFADGTSARVYRETVVDGAATGPSRYCGGWASVSRS